MAFQLRRGLNTERLQVILAEGELVYTTDTKKLFAGDGTTLGGTEVSLDPSKVAALEAGVALDSAVVTSIAGTTVTSTVDAAYVQARQTHYLDSAEVVDLIAGSAIDSAVATAIADARIALFDNLDSSAIIASTLSQVDS